MAKPINKTRINFKNIDNLIKDLSQEWSIKVGIIGQKAYEKHEGSDLTNAELGTIHEFGATINHPGGQPYIIKEDGMAQFVSKDKGNGLPKTKPHQIHIPARSFLRESILSDKGQKEIKRNVKEIVKENLTNDRELNKAAAKYMKSFADTIGLVASQRVRQAMRNNEITPPTKNISKQMRKYNPQNPTLVDSGQLAESIWYEAKQIK